MFLSAPVLCNTEAFRTPHVFYYSTFTACGQCKLHVVPVREILHPLRVCVPEADVQYGWTQKSFDMMAGGWRDLQTNSALLTATLCTRLFFLRHFLWVILCRTERRDWVGTDRFPWKSQQPHCAQQLELLNFLCIQSGCNTGKPESYSTSDIHLFLFLSFNNPV